MVWTSLHVALGETTAELTFDMVQRACDEQISESTDLDWKRDLPLSATDPEAKQAQQQEFAKDLAAMANSGGGLIVYGVDETREAERSTAANIVSVGQVDDGILRTMRQAAGNLLYPAITGVVMTPLTNGDHTVLAVAVPDSQSRPHLIHPKGKSDWFAAPWRDGPHTHWMSERQLADEYRLRDRGHQLRRDALDVVWESALQACGARAGNQWVVAVLQPEQSRRISRDLLPTRAKAAMDWAQANEMPLQDFAGGFGAGALAVTQGHEIRRGMQMRYLATQPGLNVDGRFEIHADGTVVLAVHRTNGGDLTMASATADDVAVCDIEQVGLDVVAALLATRERFAVTSDYTLRIGVMPGTQVFRRRTPGMPGAFTRWSEDERVTNFRTVEGTVAVDSRDSAITDIVELVQDAVHQTGGVPSLAPQAVLAKLDAE